MKTLRFFLGLALLGGLLGAGCSTPPKTANANTDDEYVTLPPRTGSNMPRRVKKADLLAGKVPDADLTGVAGVDKDQFANSIHPPVPKGNN